MNAPTELQRTRGQLDTATDLLRLTVVPLELSDAEVAEDGEPVYVLINSIRDFLTMVDIDKMERNCS